MKNLKIYKILCIAGVSVILVGCQNKSTNEYENKTVIMTEETREQITTEKQKEETTKKNPTSIDPTTEKITTEVPTTQEIPTTTQEQTTKAEASVESTDKMSDEEVIEYIQKIGSDMDDCADNIFDSVKSGFITVVDFLFYDGTIGGRTFDSLSDEAKGKVLALYDEISTYVEEKWPTWKENLSEKYQDVKELWNEKKDDLSDLWQSGKQKVKDWYENFRKENK